MPYPGFLICDSGQETTNTGVWAIQLKNLLNQKPVTGYVYNDFNQGVEEVRSMGIIPFISYKVEF